LCNFICQNKPMHTKKLIFSLLAFCYLLIILPSCEKNSDDTPPSVSLLSPSELEEFSVGDSIHVLADITHGSPVSSIKVSMLNENGIAILDPVYTFPGAAVYQLEWIRPAYGHGSFKKSLKPLYS